MKPVLPKRLLFSAAAIICLLPLAGRAYYSAEQGRWLSRDPIEENGSLVHAFPERAPTREDLSNPFQFCRNNGVNLLDGVGTSCLDPCAMAKAMGLDVIKDSQGDSGGVICCGGKKYACVWQVGTVNNSKAREIIEDCAFWHEVEHFDETEDCPACDFWPSRPFFRPGKESECPALTAEYNCLKDKYANNACGADSACKLALLDEMLAVLRKRDLACRTTFGGKR